MHKPSNQKALKEIADKHGASLATANEVVRSQWEFLRKLMSTIKPEEDYYPMMGIQHLGKFIVTDRRQWCFKNRPKKIKEI
ncbi:MAG: hypothetical protein KKC77_19655 [Proteobacteria bacterium]|nr:hypothetical protein [Pseudomonadota bacterium]